MTKKIASPFDGVRWFRLNLTFLGKKSSSIMKSRPVGIVQAVIEAVQARAYPDNSPQRENIPVFHFPGR